MPPKNTLPYLKCVTSLLCGPRADLWPFYNFYVHSFLSLSFFIEVLAPNVQRTFWKTLSVVRVTQREIKTE